MSETLQVAPQYQALLHSQGLRTLDSFFMYQQGDRLDKPSLESWRQRWRLQLTDGVNTCIFYMKRFERPPWRRQWQRLLSGAWSTSTAGIEWSNAQALATAGIRAVEPAAFGQALSGPLEIRSFVILCEASGESLERWVPANVPKPSAETDWQTRRERLDALARFVAKFHADGFAHRDLYLCHIFYETRHKTRDAGCEKEDTHRFCLIDLQRVFQPRWRARRWVVKDLAALDYSAPADRISEWERLRFLCRYVRECEKFGSARSLAKDVRSKSNRIARRYQRTCGENSQTVN